MSSRIDHDYFTCIHQKHLIPLSSLLASEASHHPQPHKEILDDKQVHRGTFKSEEALLSAMALVATPLRPKEWKAIPKARDSVQSEYDSLRKIKCWNEKGVREWADVKREANQKGKSVAKGRVRVVVRPRS